MKRKGLEHWRRTQLKCSRSKITIQPLVCSLPCSPRGLAVFFLCFLLFKPQNKLISFDVCLKQRVVSMPADLRMTCDSLET